MKFLLPWVSRKAAREAEVRVVTEVIRPLNVELTKAHNELSSMRHDERNQSQELFRLNERLAASASLCADKQREIAMLRTQLQEKEALYAVERAEARADRARLMDWVAKGMTGVPIFAEIPKETVVPEPEKPADPSKDPVPTELQDAISKVGRRARAVVNHITKSKDANFAEEMARGGVRRVFQEDKVDAEVAAEVIHERKSASA